MQEKVSGLNQIFDHMKVMKWNRYYTSPSTVASFIFGELCYKKRIDITTQITGTVMHNYTTSSRSSSVGRAMLS